MRGMTAAAIAAVLLVPPQEARKAERFSAVLAAGPLNPAPIGIEIGIDRWSTADARASLFDIFRSGGQPALLEALKKEKIAGYLRAPNRERLQAEYVQEEDRPSGGRRMLLLFVRYRGDWEATPETGWTDHVFRVVALTLDEKGHGTGMLFHTARVTFGKDGPDLAGELSGQPTKLLSVQKVR